MSESKERSDIATASLQAESTKAGEQTPSADSAREAEMTPVQRLREAMEKDGTGKSALEAMRAAGPAIDKRRTGKDTRSAPTPKTEEE